VQATGLPACRPYHRLLTYQDKLLSLSFTVYERSRIGSHTVYFTVPVVSCRNFWRQRKTGTFGSKLDRSKSSNTSGIPTIFLRTYIIVWSPNNIISSQEHRRSTAHVGTFGDNVKPVLLVLNWIDAKVPTQAVFRQYSCKLILLFGVLTIL
jgi:hypothetical protein